MVAEVCVLMPFDMFANPGDGGFVHEGPDGRADVEVFVVGVRDEVWVEDV